jgi:hypothetical protein
MGWRDWFTSSSKKPHSEQEEREEATSNQDAEAFAALQDVKAAEALSLFDQEEDETTPSIAVEAPYDASDAKVDDLLNETEESFTHRDEVAIEDVSDLEDPYLTATIEGDVPETVVFDDDENPSAVSSTLPNH